MAKPIKPPPWNEGVPGTARAPSAGTGGGGRIPGPNDPKPPGGPLPASLRPENRHPRVYGRGAQPATPITPWRLAATGTEHGEQAALFCWAAMAAKLGFVAADEPAIYGVNTFPGNADPSTKTISIFVNERSIPIAPVPVLSRLLAIPNGGQRDKITAGNLKAEGVKAGVPDVCLPFPLWRPVGGMLRIKYAGLFIELKRLKYKTHRNGGMSDEQVEWGGYLDGVGYRFICCHGWRAAADAIKVYINGAWPWHGEKVS